MTTYGHKKRKARKQHSCWWCAEKINTGETYPRWVWVADGRKTEIKVHPECARAWNGCEPNYECDFGENVRGEILAKEGVA